MLEVKNLSFAYKNHRVLENLSFATREGEVIFLLGKNGSGKTTLFKCIMQFLKQYTGDILIDRQSVKNMNIRQIAEKIAYIPQAHEPAYNFTVSDIVLMGTTVLTGRYRSPGKKELEVVKNALEYIDISHLANRGYAQLSGGERQLVLIARALAQKSKLMIMDEPVANLDYGNQIKIMKLVKELSNQGYTILLSTHNPEHALHFADKVLVLDNRHATMYGTPETALTAEVIFDIYGIETEIINFSTTWGDLPLIAPNINKT